MKVSLRSSNEKPDVYLCTRVELELKDVTYQFLYEADGTVFLMNPKTLEELSAPSKLVAKSLQGLLEGGAEVKVRLHDDNPMLIHPPSRNLKCTVSKVIDRSVGMNCNQGDFRYSLTPTPIFSFGLVTVDRKCVIVEIAGGARITCSSIINEGDQILISTQDGSYVGKAI